MELGGGVHGGHITGEYTIQWTGYNRHQCKKVTILSCHRCLNYSNGEQIKLRCLFVIGLNISNA